MSCETTNDKKNNSNNYLEHIKSTNDELIKRNNDLHILDKKKQFLYDCLKQKYSDLLFAWKLFEKRACVLNYVKLDNNFQINQFSYDYSTHCLMCNKLLCSKTKCENCKLLKFYPQIDIKCSICHISVKGKF